MSASALRRRLDRWLFRVGPVDVAPIRLKQRRIFVLPTGSGIAFALALLVMLLASINYNLSLGYALTFLLGGAGIASMVHAFRNLLGLSIVPGRSEPVFCGESAVFRLALQNTRNERRPALLLRAQDGATFFEIPAEDTVVISIPSSTERRGLLPIGRTVLETHWPLGLIRAWSVFVPDLECLVFPTPEAFPPALPGAAAGQRQGLRSGGSGDDDFAGLRQYRESDSPRHVAWKVLARGGPLLTKEFTGLQGGDVLLNWRDLPLHLDEEARISRLTAWVIAAERAGVAFALTLPGTALPAARGAAHRHACLRALALHGNRGALHG